MIDASRIPIGRMPGVPACLSPTCHHYGGRPGLPGRPPTAVSVVALLVVLLMGELRDALAHAVAQVVVLAVLLLECGLADRLQFGLAELGSALGLPAPTALLRREERLVVDLNVPGQHGLGLRVEEPARVDHQIDLRDLLGTH